MFLLDTNVISEIIKPRPDAKVVAWIDTVPLDDTAVTAITVAELLYGVRIMPAGARRSGISERVAGFLDRLSILPFDGHAAALYAVIAADRRRAGNPVSTFDAQIAAIARLREAILVTRDTGGFAGCGVTLLDPWET